ncbi:fibronectin type III domain-containing protein [Actinoplanes sp. N902-109]|uniref:fibronectin type III domain-containing protein n=1 Tax=Actinoplanes sp. (strain N902-109) TaxID=649831 RepID=UPI0003293587|nr:fibronectin type III domain-containing protein [Actinoplanes sp. N902-109]AGL20229.1 fibronectin type III domain-containing protein [Actinoplanes sp. N902-109]
MLSIVAGTGVAGTPVAGPAAAAPLRQPWGVAVDPSDNVYVSNFGGATIAAVTPEGTLSIVAGTGISGDHVAGPATASPLRNVMGVEAVGATLYFADYGANRVSRLVPAAKPGAPLNLQGDGKDGKLVLSFDPPADAGGTAVTSYQVSTDDGETWGTLSTTGTSPIVGTVPDIAPGTYRVRVRAVNGSGSGTATDAVQVTVAPKVPGAPTGLQATPHNGSFDLTFTVPVDDGGAPILGYDVSLEDNTEWQALTTTGTGETRTATVSNLVNGMTYPVRVRARNSAGPGAQSDSIPVTPLATKPGAPADLSVQAGNAQLTVTFTPADDGGAPVMAYEVSTDGGETWTTLVTQAGSNGTRTAVVPGLRNGTTYAVRVRAVNTAGAGAASAPVNGTPVQPAPPVVVPPAPVPTTPVPTTPVPTTPVPTTPVPTTPVPATPARINLDLDLRTGASLSGTQATLTGGGLKPASTYLLRMFSTPITIASGTTNSMGGFRAAVKIPRKACVLGGRHQLVLTGTAPDGSQIRDSSWIVLNDSCRAQAPTTATTAQLGTYLFPYQSSRLTLANKRGIRATVSAMRGAKVITVTGYTQTGKTSKAARAANKRLATRRAAVVRTYLKALGVKVRIRVVGAGAVNPASGRQKLNRRVVVTVRY